MKTPKYVIAPEGCENYLTPGKRYEAYNWEEDDSGEVYFRTKDDDGDVLLCCLEECPHGSGNWIIPDDDDDDDESSPSPVVSRVSVDLIDVSAHTENRNLIVLTDEDVGFIEIPRTHITALIEALKMMEKN